MALSELVDAPARKLAAQIGILWDFAVVLLVHFKWDEASIVVNYNNSKDDVITRSGIVTDCDFESLEASCAYCYEYGTCKNYGCSHLICSQCTKENAERRLDMGELNIRCPVICCGKMMAMSRVLPEISKGYIDLFHDGLLHNYTSSKESNDMPTRNLNLSATAYAYLSSGIRQVRDVVGFLKANKWRAVSTIVLAFFICRIICGGGTFKCVSELTILNIVARKAWLGNVVKILVLYFLCKLIRTDSVVTAIALSSAATALMIFMSIASIIRCCFRFASRLLRRTRV